MSRDVMSHDDADPDDEALSGLRSVWLSMPDEEPPSRGLADLMAAARVKADEMAEAHAEAEPSWWQRFLATLRRPQVLALATIMILIGGALFIGTRRDKLEAPAPTLSSAQDRARDGEESRAPSATTAPSPPPASAAGSASAPADKAPAEAAPGKAVVVTSPVPKADEKAKKDTSTGGAPRPRPHGTSKQEARSRFDGESTTELQVGGSTLAADDAVRAPAPTAKELLAQAREAAARGDCEAVKRLAKQIARLDAPFYRANVAPDQSLATCLN